MDVRPRVIPVCDDRCGCPTPCPGGHPGGQGCRCVTSSGGVGREEHTYCPCGDHCGCNPCMCKTTESGGVGKAFCKCGESCTCATCAS